VHHVEVFADIVCPFTHVGLRRLSEQRRERGAHLVASVRAWPLEWINGAPLDSDMAAREVSALRAQVAPEMFAGFDTTNFPTTSLPAFGLVAAAYASAESTGDSVSMAVRDALFERGADIADGAVLHEIGERFGIEPLSPGATESAVRSDWDLGVRRGVQGSPHFFVADRGWFCPNLDISHEGGRFDVTLADETMREFYAAAFG
jgi:predicted DsbA family dithiol-disulfide isomerase